MAVLFKLDNKAINDIDTTIIYPSSFNYNNDAIYYLNNNCVVITPDRRDYFDISLELYELFNVEYLRTKKDLTKFDELKLNILGSLNSDKKVYVFFNV